MTEQPILSVTGTGVASGSPDQCRIHVSLNHMAETAADALAATADIAARAMSALADPGIEKCEVRTVGLSLQDFFDQSKNKVAARVGSYQLDLIICPIDEAGGVLSLLSSAVGDALQIRGISLTLGDPEPLNSQARRLAIRDAKRRAVEIAEEVGVRLGALVSIQDESAGPSRFVQTARAIPMSGHVGAANVPIEAGNVSASSAVTLIYTIEE